MFGVMKLRVVSLFKMAHNTKIYDTKTEAVMDKIKTL